MKNFTLIFITIFLFSCGLNKKQEINQYIKRPVLTIRQDSITLFTAYPARIEGKTNVNIRSQVGGYIKEIYIEEGSYVKKGQPLFKIDDRTYIEQVNTARANLEAAMAAQKNANLEVEKYTLLSQNNITSDFQLKVAQVQYETAQANVSQLLAALQTARINLDFTLIKSPVSGFIGRIPKRIGNLTSDSDEQPLTTVSDISEVYTYFYMTEKEFLSFNSRYIGDNITEKIGKMDSVSLKLADDTDYPYRGKIQIINGEFEANSGTICVRASFKNPHFFLRTGNTGRILLSYTEKHVILVPVLSTLDIQDKIFVVRLNKENKAERVAITVSNKQGDFYIVKSGLNPGDRIVSRDLETIEEGSIIQQQ